MADSDRLLSMSLDDIIKQKKSSKQLHNASISDQSTKHFAQTKLVLHNSSSISARMSPYAGPKIIASRLGTTSGKSRPVFKFGTGNSKVAAGHGVLSRIGRKGASKMSFSGRNDTGIQIPQNSGFSINVPNSVQPLHNRRPRQKNHPPAFKIQNNLRHTGQRLNPNDTWQHDKFFEVNNDQQSSTNAFNHHTGTSGQSSVGSSVAIPSSGGYGQGRVLSNGTVVGGMVSDVIPAIPIQVVQTAPTTGIVGAKSSASSVDSVAVRVSNLHRGATVEDIRTVFSQYGAITDIKLTTDISGNSLGIATITYTSRDDALAAQESFHNKVVDGAVLKVELVRSGPAPASIAGIARLLRSNNTTSIIRH